MATMQVISEIELSVPATERHVEAARDAARYLATDKDSVKVEVEGENQDIIRTTFFVAKARQMDVCDRIMREMRMEMEDYETQSLYFPKTEAEQRREQRKRERAKERRRLAQIQRTGGK